MSFRVLVSLLALSLLVGAGFPDFRARRRTGVRANRRAAELIAPSVWGVEPKSPDHVDIAALARALAEVCGPMPKGRAESYATWIEASARRHAEDPFLLAAVMHRSSRCLPDARTVEGVGLTAIQPTMYLENVRGTLLRYPVPTLAGWEPREKKLPRVLTEESLLSAETNLEWAAALLAMWREQHEVIDAKFEQLPHRHHVSHFVWGDRVKSARAEDRIFTDRRRLLAHYGLSLPAPTTSFQGLAFGPPLEGSPRVVSSQPGADRDEGLRVHRGVDVEAAWGEPVLAIADGQVSFAGVDLPGEANNADLAPSKIGTIARAELGRGGRYVCITHVEAHGDEAWLRSCYMHLEEVRVRSGQRVRRGDVVGSVGRTGMKSSSPHLHLEIKSDRRLYDAREVLAGILIGEPPIEPKKKKRRRSAAPETDALVNTRP